MSHRAYTVDEALNFQPQRYLIDGILPEGLTLMAGQPKTGKSFLALDWAMCIGTGMNWQDKETVSGSVLYMQSEAPGTLPKRLDSWLFKAPRPPSSVDLKFILEQTDLRDGERTISDIGEHLTDATLLVIDTLSRNNHGSETDDRDMPALVKTCDLIRDTFGTSVLLVHHSTKESNGQVSSWYRGHSSLTGAIDMGISVTRRMKDELCIKVACEMPRHDEPFEPLALHAELCRESLVLTPCFKDHGKKG